MLANFFGKSKPINSIFIVIYFITIYGLSVFKNRVPFEWKVLPLFLILFGLSNFINRKNLLTFENSYFFMFLVILLGLFPYTISINSMFYINLILLFAVRRIYSLQSKKDTLKKIFDASLLISTAFIMEPKTLIFTAILYGAILIHGKINIRTIITPLLGFITPIILYSSYCFWTEKKPFLNTINQLFTYDNLNIYFTTKKLIPIVLIAILSLLSILLKTPKVLRVLNAFRKLWLITLLHFITCLILIISLDKKNGTEIIYIIFPTALILANGLELYQTKKISEIILISLISTTLIINIF